MKKKWKFIIIIILVILGLLAAGLTFFFWRKDAPDYEKNIDPRGENGENGYVNSDGYSTWRIIFPPGSSEERAKEEFVEAIWRHGGTNWTKQEIEKQLIKDASRLNFPEIREWEKEFSTSLLEQESLWKKIYEKYHEKVFHSPPNQSKFKEKIREAGNKLFVLSCSADYLELKPNGEIDWISSLETLMHGRPGKKKPRKKNKETFQKISNYIEKKEERTGINFQLVINAASFPYLTNLKALNEWVNTLAELKERGQWLLYKRWKIAKKTGEKYGRPIEAPEGSKGEFKNQKFNLSYKINIFALK